MPWKEADRKNFWDALDEYEKFLKNTRVDDIVCDAAVAKKFGEDLGRHDKAIHTHLEKTKAFAGKIVDEHGLKVDLFMEVLPWVRTLNELKQDLDSRVCGMTQKEVLAKREKYMKAIEEADALLESIDKQASKIQKDVDGYAIKRSRAYYQSTDEKLSKETRKKYESEKDEYHWKIDSLNAQLQKLDKQRKEIEESRRKNVGCLQLSSASLEGRIDLLKDRSKKLIELITKFKKYLDKLKDKVNK